MAAHLLLIQVGRGFHQRERVAAAPRHERPYDVRVQLGATLLQELPGALGVEAFQRDPLVHTWRQIGVGAPGQQHRRRCPAARSCPPGSTDQPGDARSPRASVRQ